MLSPEKHEEHSEVGSVLTPSKMFTPVDIYQSPCLIDFSRNSAEQQDTYMKLINVNTFESMDFGIGLKKAIKKGKFAKKKKMISPFKNHDGEQGGGAEPPMKKKTIGPGSKLIVSLYTSDMV